MAPQLLRNKLYFSATIILSLIALVAVIPVSYDTLTTDEKCPMMGVVPACYVVMIGYFLIALSCVFRKYLLFYIGWIPVFLLAAIGSVAEVFGVDVCPKTEGGIPMCYFSLGFALLIAATFYGWKKTNHSEAAFEG